MKLGDHAKIETVVFLVLLYFLGFQKAAVIALAHFIPTIDYVMGKLNIRRELHRQLFHNVFVAAASGILLYWVFGATVGVLGLLNILFHFAIDLGGNGVALFFPFSGKRFKLSGGAARQRKSDCSSRPPKT